MADNLSRAGQRYVDADLLAYVERVHASQDTALQAAFDAPGLRDMPAIQVGKSEGKLLGMLLRLAGARKVVEIGTLAGYSAIHLARALPAEGHVWTIEYDPKHHAIAKENIDLAGLTTRVTCLLGSALDVLPTLVSSGPFDAVFIDADKGNYDRYGEWSAAHLRTGGLLLGDNAHFFGRLMEDSEDAQAMRRFHENAARAFDTVCIPTPDGLLLGIKR
jgi:predicted O-methyltransferase YrrM